MAKKVYLGVGHGGLDSGAVAGGFKEKDLNLAISLACKAELERHAVEVKISRTTDKDSTVNSKVKECNSFGADLCVEIHNNAGGGDGAEAYYHYKGGKSKTLAINVLSELMCIGQNSRGAKIKKNILGKDYFAMIRETVCPAILVECAFLDNMNDIQIIDTPEEQKIIGIAIAKGILKTFGIDYKPIEVNPITVKKSNEEIAAEVKAGKWGNGAERKTRLTEAGYDYAVIQGIINGTVSTATAVPSKKSNEDIAREVIQGKWGNGEARRTKLSNAGYNPSEIQAIVNEMLK